MCIILKTKQYKNYLCNPKYFIYILGIYTGFFLIILTVDEYILNEVL